MMWLAPLAAALAMYSPDAAPRRCSVADLRYNPEGYVWPLAKVEGFVREANLIVRAKAIGVGPRQSPQPRLVPSERGSIAFQILEVLKGDTTSSRLLVPGDSAATDDFNRGTVPYRIVRSDGQRGNCFATTYRLGGEYLLLLKFTEGVAHPYWAPLAPLNEQITGRDHPWATWVREQATKEVRSVSLGPPDYSYFPGCYDLSTLWDRGVFLPRYQVAFDTVRNAATKELVFQIRFTDLPPGTVSLSRGTWRLGAGDSVLVSFSAIDTGTSFIFEPFGRDTVRGRSIDQGLPGQKDSGRAAIAVKRTRC